jgi:TolB protein
MMTNFKNIFFITIATALIFMLPYIASAGLTIDIVKAPRKLPIAIMELTGPYGNQISEIISADLAFSGLFEPLDSETFIERPGQRFSKARWAGTGAEAVVKGDVLTGDILTVNVRLYDVVEGHSVMAKKYTATRDLIRPIAHSIANDIYQQITGNEGIFRSRIAYIKKEEKDNRLYLADWDGHREKYLGVKADNLIAPRWHWEGKKLIYSALRNTSWGIYRVDISTLRERALINQSGTNIAGGFFPKGDRFTFSSSKEGTPDIFSYYVKKGKISRLTRGYGIEVSPSISPNGKDIVYVSDRTGKPQIYTMDKFGYNKTRLTYKGSYNTSPSWSPDGKVITYSGWSEGKNQIFTIRTDGRGTRQITSLGNNEEPSFSPDGRFIVFTSDRDGKRAIYIMSSSGQEQVRISPNGVVVHSPQWSPTK